MNKGEFIVAESVFAALYLRGLGGRLGLREPGLARRRWPRVEGVLRDAGCGLGSVGEVLRRYGLWDEAAVVEEPGRLDAALSAVMEERVLTVFGAMYPARWRVVLGAGAPPVLWRLGYAGEVAGDGVGVVGVREGSETVLGRAYLVGAALAGLGKVVCSGGAWGVDRAAVSGALSCFGVEGFAGADGGRLRTVEILPFGMNRMYGLNRVHSSVGGGGLEDGRAWAEANLQLAQEGRLVLSLNAPEAGFTTGQAMERNALIYAFGPAAVVVKAHFKRGGTWAGATDALRRRLTSVLVGIDGEAASETLVRLGGTGVRFCRDGDEQREVLAAALSSLGSDYGLGPTLFGSAEVRERSVGFGGLRLVSAGRGGEAGCSAAGGAEAFGSRVDPYETAWEGA